MNRALIPLAAAATFVAVYQLTPAPAAKPVEPVPVAAAATPVAEPMDAVRPASRAKRRTARRPSARRPARTAVRGAPRKAYAYYSGCNEVRAAGLAPLYRGQPGYREDMDGDLDGIACEPHRHRR
jgi:hypothetical protein